MTPAPSRRQHYGIGVSPGAAVGPVVRMRARVRPPQDEPTAADPAAAGQRVREALAAVAENLQLQAQQADATVREILEATAMMARDPGLAVRRRRPPRLRLRPGHRPGRRHRGLLRRVRHGRRLRRRARHRPARRRRPRHRGVAGSGRAGAARTGRAVRPRGTRPGSGGDRGPRPRPHPRDHHRGGWRAQPHGGARRPAGDTRGGAAGCCAHAGRRHAGRRRRRRRAGGRRPRPGLPRRADRAGRTTRQGLRLELRAGAHPRRRGRGAHGQHRHGPGRARRGGLRCRGRGPLPDRAALPRRRQRPSLDWQTETYRQVFEPFGDRCVVVRTLDAGADKPLAFADLGPRATPPSADAGCACRPCARTCSTPSSRRWAGPRGPPAPTSASWHPWWPPPTRPRGSPAGSGRTACPRSG